jgi:hypothetical protein
MKKIILFLTCFIGLQALAQEKMRISLNDGTYMDYDARIVKSLTVVTPTPLDLIGDWVSVSGTTMASYSFKEDNACSMHQFNMTTSYHIGYDLTYTYENDEINFFLYGTNALRISVQSNTEAEFVSSTGAIHYKVQGTYSMAISDEPISIGNTDDVIKYADNYFVAVEDNKIKALKDGSGYVLVEDTKSKETKAYKIEVDAGPLPDPIDWTQYFKKSKDEIIELFGSGTVGTDKTTYTISDYNIAISSVVFTFSDDWSKVTGIQVKFYDADKMQNYIEYIAANYILASGTKYYDTDSISTASVCINVVEYLKYIQYLDMKK